MKDKQLEARFRSHFTEQVLALNKKRFSATTADMTAADDDVPVDALGSQIQLVKNSDGTPILPPRIVDNIPVNSKVVKMTLRLYLNAHYCK